MWGTILASRNVTEIVSPHNSIPLHLLASSFIFYYINILDFKIVDQLFGYFCHQKKTRFGVTGLPGSVPIAYSENIMKMKMPARGLVSRGGIHIFPKILYPQLHMRYHMRTDYILEGIVLVIRRVFRHQRYTWGAHTAQFFYSLLLHSLSIICNY
jgi:hypothetical protein